MSSRIKDDVVRLFECWCELKYEFGLNAHATICEHFPESFSDENIMSQIPKFAFPCEFESTSVETYSFVLTGVNSKFRFGFCRYDPKAQTSMVVITHLPWHDTFLKFMAVLGELRRNQSAEFALFLNEAYNIRIPERGCSLKLFYNSGQNHFIFERPSQFELPSIPENHYLNLYYNFVDTKNMIAVFAAMLCERRIIFTSRRLDRLSSCIQAASAFLYPMVWQHLFIPILPMQMKDILDAPMPYLIGVPEALFRTVNLEELGEVVILNCDNNEFKTPFDDVRKMPLELISQMKKQLANSADLIGDRISRIFLRVLVQLIGGYRDAAKYSQGQRVTWDRDIFIESRSPHLRDFLTSMLELQIFQQFIDERMDILNSGQGISDEFEMETLRYTDMMGKKNKNYRDFLRNVKDKTNPAVKSAVKSVKEGSRGVKTVYRDLKSKLRDIPPPKSEFHISTSSADALNNLSLKQSNHSAPHSPVFSRHNINADVPWDAPPERTFYNSSKSNCNTSINAGLSEFSSEYVVNNNNNNLCSFNRPINTTPTISPSSSLCCSDMNISQELQNHPLFKSPHVDRSLKPRSSLELEEGRSAQCSGSAILMPAMNAATSSSSKEMLTFDCRKTEMNELILKSTHFPSTKTMFDSPPRINAPPIPPKRKNDSFLEKKRLNQQSSMLKNIDGSDIRVEPCRSLMHTNYGPETKINDLMSATTNSCFPITKNLRSTTSSDQCKEQMKCSADTTKDLISLDVNGSNSLDLADFDPLKQTAQSSLQSMDHRTKPTNTQLLLARNRTDTDNSKKTAADDLENELLRQYGLDKFHLSNDSEMQSRNLKSGWTTFD